MAGSKTPRAGDFFLGKVTVEKWRRKFFFLNVFRFLQCVDCFDSGGDFFSRFVDMQVPIFNLTTSVSRLLTNVLCCISSES